MRICYRLNVDGKSPYITSAILRAVGREARTRRVAILSTRTVKAFIEEFEYITKMGRSFYITLKN